MYKPYCNLQTLHSVFQSLPHGLQTIRSPLVFHFSFIVLCLFCSWKILSPPQTPSAAYHTGDFHLLGDTGEVLVCSMILQCLVDILVFHVIWHEAIQYFPTFHRENPEVKISWKYCSFSFFLLNRNLQNPTNATAYNGHWRGHLSALPCTKIPTLARKGHHFILSTHQLENSFLFLPLAGLLLTWVLLLSMTQIYQENLMVRDTRKQSCANA